MVINIQINKKDVFLFAAILVFFVGAGFVIATVGTPTTNGHSLAEIQLPACPSSNMVLKWDGSNWICGADNVGGGGSNFNAYWKDAPVAALQAMFNACGYGEYQCCNFAYANWCQTQMCGSSVCKVGVMITSSGAGWCNFGGSNIFGGFCLG